MSTGFSQAMLVGRSAAPPPRAPELNVDYLKTVSGVQSMRGRSEIALSEIALSEIALSGVIVVLRCDWI